MANPMTASQSADAVDTTGSSDALIDFGRCVKSYEVQAAALNRGFKTALFIQQFKSGLLRGNELKEHRVQSRTI
jgi:hypothetical protein